MKYWIQLEAPEGWGASADQAMRLSVLCDRVQSALLSDTTLSQFHVIKAKDQGVIMESQKSAVNDPVNHPAHYTSHPSGVECIEVAEHYGFNVGNAIKYLWRAGLKGDAVQDLEKARWYLDREIQKRKKANG